MLLTACPAFALHCLVSQCGYSRSCLLGREVCLLSPSVFTHPESWPFISYGGTIRQIGMLEWFFGTNQHVSHLPPGHLKWDWCDGEAKSFLFYSLINLNVIATVVSLCHILLQLQSMLYGFISPGPLMSMEKSGDGLGVMEMNFMHILAWLRFSGNPALSNPT